MHRHRVAALQMVSGDDLAANLEAAERLIGRAAAEGAELAVLPESFAMFNTRAQKALGEREAGLEAEVRPFVRQQAKLHRLWIVGGTIPIIGAEGERVYAASYVVNTDGEEVARYDKMHLFDVDVGDKQGSYRESDTFVSGNNVVVVDSPVGRLGVAVCYDIRFPELFRAMLAQDVDVVAIPSAFTLLTGEAHWLPLLKARAIESQCYIVGANQGGAHSKSRCTSGGSVIVDGWGMVLAEAGRGEACVVADIDLAKLEKIRSDMPLKQHLRFDVIQRK